MQTEELISKASSKSRWWQAVGILLIVGSFYFVGSAFWLERQTLQSLLHTPHIFLSVLEVTLLWGAGLILLAGAWALLLRQWIVQPTSHWPLMRYCLQANLLKYLPGNFMHFVGRHALAAQHGVSHADILTTVFIEVALLAAAAILFGSVLLQWMGHGILVDYAWVLPTAIFGLPIGLLILLTLLRQQRIISPFSPTRLMAVFVCYLAFFMLMALGLYLLGGAIGVEPSKLGIVVGTYILAWAAGYVLPGAPAGLGVREAVFLLLAAGAAPEAHLLIVLAAMRVANLLADVMAFATGFVGRTTDNAVQKDTG